MSSRPSIDLSGGGATGTVGADASRHAGTVIVVKTSGQGGSRMKGTRGEMASALTMAPTATAWAQQETASDETPAGPL